MTTIPQEASEDGRQRQPVFQSRSPGGDERRAWGHGLSDCFGFQAGYQDTSPACSLSPGGVPKQGSRLAAILYVTYEAGSKNEPPGLSR